VIMNYTVNLDLQDNRGRLYIESVRMFVSLFVNVDMFMFFCLKFSLCVKLLQQPFELLYICNVLCYI